MTTIRMPICKHGNTGECLACYDEEIIRLRESLAYVEAYLESAAEDERASGRQMSAEPLLSDVRGFIASNARFSFVRNLVPPSFDKLGDCDA